MTHRVLSRSHAVCRSHVLRGGACALALAAGPFLSGCSGVVKNLDSAQVSVPNVNVANPFGLDKHPTGITLTGASGQGGAPAAFPFTGQAVSLTQIKDAQLSAGLAPTATLDGTGPLPASFTVQGITVNATISAAGADGTAAPGGVTLPPLQTSGPVTFTLGPDGKTYSAGTSDIALSQPAHLSAGDAQTLLGIVTGGASKSDVAVVTTSAPVTDPALAGRTLTITFDTSSLKVISS